jgi:hypothetical protein
MNKSAERNGNKQIADFNLQKSAAIFANDLRKGLNFAEGLALTRLDLCRPAFLLRENRCALSRNKIGNFFVSAQFCRIIHFACFCYIFLKLPILF